MFNPRTEGPELIGISSRIAARTGVGLGGDGAADGEIDSGFAGRADGVGIAGADGAELVGPGVFGPGVFGAGAFTAGVIAAGLAGGPGLKGTGFKVGFAAAIAAAAIGTSAVVASAGSKSASFTSALLASAFLAAAFASAILASISFAASLAENAGTTGFCADAGTADGGPAGFGVAACDGTFLNGPPHMPQKRLFSGFEFPQRGQRKVVPQH